MRRLWTLSFGLLLFASAQTASASILALEVASGGIDSDLTRTCATVSCSNSGTLWSLASGELYAASGTLSIDTVLNQLSFSLAVATSVLDQDAAAAAGLPAQPATDQGATSLMFTGGSYAASGLTVTPTPGPGGSTTYTLGAGLAAALSFANVVPTGAGAGAPLSLAAVRVTGSCLVHADNTGQCGLTFGSSGTTPFKIPGGGGFGGYDRNVRQSLNLGVTLSNPGNVPEPGTLLLVGAGLVGLAALRRAPLGTARGGIRDPRRSPCW